jgi:hypothetical protein
MISNVVAQRFRPVPIPHMFEFIGFRSELFGKFAKLFFARSSKESRDAVRQRTAKRRK